MKKNKIFYIVLFWGMLLLPLIDYAVAQTKPNYAGINEDQTYIWSTTFNKGPFEDFIEDLGFSEQYAENYTDWWFDLSEWDEDVEAWKVYIIQIKDEKEMDYGNREIDYVPYLYNFYEKYNSTKRFHGFFVESFKDWEGELPSILTYCSDKNLFIYPFGIYDHQGQARSIYQFYANYLNKEKSEIRYEILQTNQENIFSVVVFFCTIILLLIYKRNYRFRCSG